MLKHMLIVAGLALSGGAVFVAEAESPGKATLALFPQGMESCYVRPESPGPAKPKQMISSFMLYRLLRPDPAKEEIEGSVEQAAMSDRAPGIEQWISVLVTFRGFEGYYHQTVSCRDNPGRNTATCARDCDGGGFAAVAKTDGLIADFDNGYGGLSLEISCDPDEEGRDRRMTPEEAGGAVPLERRPIADCLAADEAARPGFAEDPMPLRERVAVSGWRCLKRVYDKAHLKRHPKQNVTAMAIAIKGQARVETDGDGWRYTLLDVTLSLRLRDGMKASKPVTCTADAFQFRCGEEFRLRRRNGESAILLAGSYGGEVEWSGAAPHLNGLNLGADDMVFRLDASEAPDCDVP